MRYFLLIISILANGITTREQHLHSTAKNVEKNLFYAVHNIKKKLFTFPAWYIERIG